MKLLIAGGDARAAYAAHEAERRALSVSALGLENSPLSFPRASWEDVSQADAVLMANPWRTPFPGPLGKAIDADALINALRPGTRLVFPDVLKKPASFARTHLCLSDSEDYLRKNAVLTAEGALHALMSRAAFSLQGARALIIGYGRIGRDTALRLRDLGCTVCACARREESRALARADGLFACGFGALGGRLGWAELIVTTVPGRVMETGELKLIQKSAVLIDVASAPYGFSLDDALALGLNAARENNLPGRYCPMSAGIVQLNAFLELIGAERPRSHEEGGDLT